MTKDKLINAISISGLCIVAIGALLPLMLGPQSVAARVILSAGAAILLIGRLFTPYRGKIFRVKRLFVIEKWAALFFCTAAFFMWYSDNPREWVVFLLAGAFIQLYTSIAIPRVENKAIRDDAAQRQAKKHRGEQ